MIYLVPIIIGFILSYYEVKKGKINKRIKLIFVLVSALIFCGGYMTGSDWRGYELLYDSMTTFRFGDYYKEQGFYLLVYLFKRIGFGFFPFIIICKFFVFYSFNNFIEKHSPFFFLPFTIFLSSNALFLFVDNPLRFMIAAGIILFSFDFAIKESFLPVFLLVLLAATFHISSLLMLLIYFVPHIKILNKALSITAYVVLFLSVTPEIFGNIIGNFFNDLFFADLFVFYIDRADYELSASLTTGSVVRLLFFILIVLNREIFNVNDKTKNIYKFTIVYFYLHLLSVIPTFFRIPIFLSVFFYISISYLIVSFKNRKIVINYIIIAYFLLSTAKNIYATWVYIPYSNYFVSLFQDEKDYFYRSNYNIQKYYERTGEFIE